MTLTGLLSFFTDHPLAIIATLALLLFAIVVSSTWIIRENESGLVIKKYGPALAAGRLAGCPAPAAYREGQELVGQGRVPEGLERLEEASRLEPGSARYRAAVLQTRERLFGFAFA
jgi:hypothetical protein